jgi:hypothetical protein
MNQELPDLPSHAPRDDTGWSQPAAEGGAPGAFVDRPPVAGGSPLAPGAGSPVQPGPPMSVHAPMPDRIFNLGAAALVAAIAVGVVLVLVVVFLVVGALAHH